jgi:hypothetical protein
MEYKKQLAAERKKYTTQRGLDRESSNYKSNPSPSGRGCGVWMT